MQGGSINFLRAYEFSSISQRGEYYDNVFGLKLLMNNKTALILFNDLQWIMVPCNLYEERGCEFGVVCGATPLDWDGHMELLLLMTRKPCEQSS